jgi:SAM-dependent methyltransferase
MTQTSNQKTREYTQQNRRAWNEIAEVRSRGFPPAEFFASGQTTVAPQAVQAAQQLFGDLRNLRVIHLQCSTGEDTLSWSVLGAQAVGVDIAEQQIEIARQKAAQAGLTTQFAAADVYDLPDALPAELRAPYDLVFTGGGAIVWLPDLAGWAQVVSALLRPGGRLVLVDEHPVGQCLWTVDGHLQVISDYFGRSVPEQETGWAHFQGGEQAQETKYEFNWPLGDVFTAIAQAGLIIERMEEYPGGPEWRYAELQGLSRRLPGEYMIVAKKPEAD